MKNRYYPQRNYSYKNFLPTDTVYSDNNPDNGYLLYFGRISEEKGVLTLVKAVEKLENNIPLIILGTGPIEDEIKEYIKAHNLGNRIKALGFKSGDELKSMLQKRNASSFPVSGTKTDPIQLWKQCHRENLLS